MTQTEAFSLTRPEAGTLGLQGSLSFATAARALRLIEAAVAAEQPQRLDLSPLRHGDSAGLACLLAVQAEAMRKGHRLQVVHMPDGLRALAQLCEVEAFIL
ncbi:STAS domain-containing protein [Aerosticca soli]|uniref:STAS domain-containing protein n=1 Tax=Aerosticca soli TaxID=2010829 RepID=A0A2Z6E426_9GAMM|nr:STAS domain-containing protein [Aerosticca soli]BBD79318.1 hypothetical protein ALSL_0651 [Aerosticca soli]